jgi:hypothetical protein
LNWHIHTKPINPSADNPAGQCGGAVTSGHSDNGFACGGASEWGATTCRYLYSLTPGLGDDNFKTVYGTKCHACSSGSCTGCEYGDLSGKLGKISVDSEDLQTFTDTHIEPIETYGTMSLVLHCCTAAGCGERIACGDIEYLRH